MKKKLLSLILAGMMAAGCLTGCGEKQEVKQESKEGKKIKIAVLPKMVGENYWDACGTGCQEAYQELKDKGVDVELFYDGPPQDQATNQKQVDLLEGWIAQGVDAIAVGCVDGGALSPTLRKAMEKGIKIVTFDSDSEADARDLFINQASYDGIGKALVENAAKQLKEKGYGPDSPANIVILGQTKTDTNVEAWKDAILALIATDEYSWMKLQNPDTDIYYPGSDESENQSQAGTVISRMGRGADKIQCAFGITSMTGPALGSQYEAAADKPNKDDIVLLGVATPNALKSYLLDENNPLKAGFLWNCMDLGYLAVQTAYQLVTGDVTPDAAKITTDRLGDGVITDKQLLLGDPLVITKENVEQFNY